jgi:TetR/AcrR family transcriptional regulator, mexJK operon transcriptional repressor
MFGVMNARTQKRLMGRPPDVSKRTAILDATRALIEAYGFSGLSIEAVAAAAGVSKVTVYNQFEDRIGLFTALVGRESDWMEFGLSRLKVADGPLEDRLTAFGIELLGIWSRPDVVRFDLQMALVGEELRTLKEAFFSAGPARLHAAVEHFILEETLRERLNCNDPVTAADLLISLWRATISDRARFGLDPLPTADAREEGARNAAQVFLKIYGA